MNNSDDRKTEGELTGSGVKETFSANLKYFRQCQNLTQEKLAEKARLSALAISKLENCQEWPSSATLASLCNALGISLWQLFYTDVENGIVPKDLVFEALEQTLSSFKEKISENKDNAYVIKHKK